MNSKRSTILLAVALVVVIAGSIISYNVLAKKSPPEKTEERDHTDLKKSNASNEEKEKQLAPDFVLYDMEKTPINFDDFKGKNIVINFWASWCGFCKAEMEGFNNVYNENKDNENIVFIMLNVTDGENHAQGKRNYRSS